MNLREEARKAALKLRDAVPDEPPTHDEYAEAVSDVYMPVIEDLLCALAIYSGRLIVSTDEHRERASRAMKLLGEARASGTEADQGG